MLCNGFHVEMNMASLLAGHFREQLIDKVPMA